MVDTRAGLWLQLAVVALTVLVVLFVVLAGNAGDRLPHRAWAALQPSAILLPVVSILLVASEWTQRTALIPFTLVPERSRVLRTAKLGAGTVLALGAFAVGAAIAAVGTAVAPGPRWHVVAARRPHRPGGRLRRHRDDHGHRLRRGAAQHGARDRPLLRAADRLVGTRLALVPARRRGWLDSSRTLDRMGEQR